ncbi:MAG: hypothetical protein K2K29_00810, partial [Muribaculaceae bacterium]|nr:hypothetical protein [Muribaculaceae bacterium]
MHLIKAHIHRIMMPALLCMGLAATSCSGADKDDDAGYDSTGILVMVGDSAISTPEVANRIPSGISPVDSAAMARAIVDGWIERQLLTDIASQNVEDMEKIDRMVEDYRKKLIIATYRRNLRRSHIADADKKRINEYYQANKDDLILEMPVIKGLYVKLPADADRLSDIRRWIQTATPDAIDALEKYGLKDAIEYSFFQQRWTDWATISRQIPYNFGNPDTFVQNRRNLITTHRGITYMLHISESLPSGSPMPREIADPIIMERLETLRGDALEKEMMGNIYQ